MASILVGSFPAVASSGSYVTKASRYKTEKIQNKYHIVRRQKHYRGIEVGSCHQWAKSFAVDAAPGDLFESDKPQHFPKPFWGSVKYYLYTFSRFTKPYVSIGTAISITSMALLTVEKLSDISLTYFIGLFQAIVAATLMCSYVIGLNNLTDVEIDKINKPNRPLASGEYSFETGVILTAACLILSFGIGWIVGSPPLLWALSIHFLLGTAYSIDLPLLRWKRIAALAAMCIVVVQGIIFQVAYFLHMQTYVLKRPTMLPRSVIFATAFMSFFCLVLALFKDIPDTEGDEKFGIQSLSVHLGQKRVFWICVSLLEMIYGVAILVGATSSRLWSKMIMVLAHALLASILWYHAKSVDLKSNSAIESFYMFIWKLFYAEYIIILLLR
ncbi:probable homogentisate phytyltransferase 1, chloroplastic [Vigna radiata var. radiata]|uniref:Probable homogentisate phytyltransferase 1, chloroplastic n=1 Tax=Vigna radiata var. radiata TaxID=3916 RepID=A0A1S3TG72_VIGRR|nr:probable homogentisate phytyltransferase 1, chloroplastic [Vigna radiata var. radiata]